MSTAPASRSGRDARHLMRYLKAKAGLSPVEIAKSEHVSIKTVNDSIQAIERYEQQNTEGQLQLAVRDLVISTIPQAKETLHGLLTATETVMKKNLKTGKDEYVTVEDKTTRLEGTRLVRDLVIGMQPKGPGVAVQVNKIISRPSLLADGNRRREHAAAAGTGRRPTIYFPLRWWQYPGTSTRAKTHRMTSTTRTGTKKRASNGNPPEPTRS